MSKILNLLSWSWNVGLAERTIEEAADVGYNTAVDMCGNNGQVAVIDLTGYDAFHTAAELCYNGEDGLGHLMMVCPYPDAVGMILEESYGVIEEYIAEVQEDLFGDGGESEETEEWD